MKTVTIIRGVSGSGKTTYGVFLKSLMRSDTIICCADDYFTDSKTGEYNFDPTKLGSAHKRCMEKFITATSNDVSHVIVNNTSTVYKTFSKYIKVATEKGYKVHVICMENHHGGTNVHNVPQNILDQQVQNIKKSFKPI